MIPVPSGVRVWLAVGRTDMRRGMNTLALQVQETLRRDPHAGAMIAAFGIMPAATKALLELHPKVHISIAIKAVQDIGDWVATGPFDVGITRMPLEDVRVECEPLVTGNCILVIPPDHRLALKRFVSLQDLRGERMIETSHGNMHRDLIAGAFASAGVPYSGSVDLPTGISACQFVAEGLGLAIIDPYALSTKPDPARYLGGPSWLWLLPRTATRGVCR
jgi:DNA-binding transcriptional LysR family regulator